METLGFVIGATGMLALYAGAIWIVWRIIRDLFAIVAGVTVWCFRSFVISNAKKTRLHYYDYPDRYFDYESGEWHWKAEPGSSN